MFNNPINILNVKQSIELNKDWDVKMKSKEKTLYIRRARKQKAMRYKYFVEYMPRRNFGFIDNFGITQFNWLFIKHKYFEQKSKYKII